MKQKLLVLITITLLANSAMLFSFLLVGQYGAKLHFAISKPNAEQQIHLSLSSTAYLKYKQGENEILIGDQRYDIVSVNKINNQIEIDCYRDEDEEFFSTQIRMLSHLNNTASDDGEKTSHHLLQYLLLFYDGEQASFSFYTLPKLSFQSYGEYCFTSKHLSILAPPPKA